MLEEMPGLKARAQEARAAHRSHRRQTRDADDKAAVAFMRELSELQHACAEARAEADEREAAVASQDAELDHLRARYDALGHAARERRATADASCSEHVTRMAALREETHELRARVRAAELARERT